jgi:hypothetical protein
MGVAVDGAAVDGCGGGWVRRWMGAAVSRQTGTNSIEDENKDNHNQLQ